MMELEWAFFIFLFEPFPATFLFCLWRFQGFTSRDGLEKWFGLSFLSLLSSSFSSFLTPFQTCEGETFKKMKMEGVVLWKGMSEGREGWRSSDRACIERRAWLVTSKFPSSEEKGLVSFLLIHEK